MEMEITANISLDRLIAASIGDMPSSTFENIFGDYNSVIDYKPSCKNNGQ
jgi:hypothetical protein